MAKSKYVIHKEDGPIIFSERANHNDIISPTNCESTGFFSVEINPQFDYGINVVCYGESISLKIKSRPEDAVLIKSLILNVPPYLFAD